MSVSPQSIEGGAPADGVIAKAATGAKYALFLLFAINLLNFFDRQLLGALAEPIRLEFHLNDAALGLLGSIFTVIYALVGLPLGTLSDKWYRNRLIAVGTLFWSLLTAATGFAQNYAQMFIARLGVGVGEATCAPAGQSLIGDLFPPHSAREGHGCLHARAAGGHFSGLYQRRRHRHEIRLARGILVCLRARSDSRHAWRCGCPNRCAAHSMRAESCTTAQPRRPKSPYAAVLGLPTMWWIIMSGIFHNFNMYAINTFNTPSCSAFIDMSLLNASYVSSISVGAVGAIGLLVGGWLADKMSVKRRNGRLVLVGLRHGDRRALYFPRDQSAEGRDRGLHDSDGARHHHHVSSTTPPCTPPFRM